MLEASWEAQATKLANADNVVEVLQKIIKATKPDLAKTPHVILAQDTRPSSTPLASALEDGLRAISAEFTNYGLMTTPQLHYLVRCLNTDGTSSSYGTPSEQGYYEKLAKAFRQLVKGKPRPSPLYVDCANGVGAPKLRALQRAVGDDILDLRVVNDAVDDASLLNHQCGADFVKTQQKIPPKSSVTPLDRCAGLDGDADRLVYYFIDGDGNFHLLDGDKIASLIASFFKDLVKASGVNLNLGVVQTAYANGSSTAYIAKTLKLPTVCVPTGVKHLHHAAQRFQIGVYFEANGHGTVLFSAEAASLLAAHEPSSPAQFTALQNLLAASDLINQTVGDALSDLLLVEAILAHKGWSLSAWDGIYTDLPNRLVRVVVRDRTIFTTTDAERRLVTPAGMQEKLDSLVAKYTDGRAFVRASGTENAVRAYAEAATRSEADELAVRCSNLIEEAAGT